MSLNKEVKISQFQVTHTPYSKINDKGEVKQKISTKTEKICNTTTYQELYQMLLSSKKNYTIHKYQVYNDRHHWPKIWCNVSEGFIYHMDFSETLTQQHKFEPQFSHFNEQQYSLHCTVKHTNNPAMPYEYLYHLSNDMKHDYAFTSVVVDELIASSEDSTILRFKSDNCATQSKCKCTFNCWLTLSHKLNKIFFLYYGVSGQGKGLLDAMKRSPSKRFFI